MPAAHPAGLEAYLRTCHASLPLPLPLRPTHSHSLSCLLPACCLLPYPRCSPLCCTPHRPYTPTTELLQRGHVDFVIKLYPDGAMSGVLAALAVGDSLLFKGPKGRFAYERGTVKAFGGCCRGSGCRRRGQGFIIGCTLRACWRHGHKALACRRGTAMPSVC